VKLQRKRWCDMSKSECDMFVYCWNYSVDFLSDEQIERIGLSDRVSGRSELWLSGWIEENIPFDQFEIVNAFGLPWLVATHPVITGGDRRKARTKRSYFAMQQPSIMPQRMVCCWYVITERMVQDKLKGCKR
jgi:hypothetical protein